MSDHWTGPDNFEYWTVSHYDQLYHNWGHVRATPLASRTAVPVALRAPHRNTAMRAYPLLPQDIVFKDGPTGVTWRWGNFNVSQMPGELFELPAGADCSKKCSKLMASEDHAAALVHARLARLGA